MKKTVGVSVALDINRDDFEEAFNHINRTVDDVTKDLPLKQFDAGFGFGARDIEWEVIEGDPTDLEKKVKDRISEAGVEIVEHNYDEEVIYEFKVLNKILVNAAKYSKYPTDLMLRSFWHRYLEDMVEDLRNNFNDLEDTYGTDDWETVPDDYNGDDKEFWTVPVEEYQKNKRKKQR